MRGKSGCSNHGFAAATLVLVWAMVAVPALAQPTAAICVPGNIDRLSSDRCRCSGSASLECIGSCVAMAGQPGRCDGASNVDPPICLEPGNLGNSSADGCPCNVNGDCIGNCVAGRCEAGSTAAACVGISNGFNLSPNGCPCAVNGDCIGDCDPLTRTCAGLVGQVFDRLPTLVAEAERPVIFVGESTRDLAAIDNAVRWPSTVRFALYGPTEPSCFIAAVTGTIAYQGEPTLASSPFVAHVSGVWRWRATYLGNAWNRLIASPCQSPLQQVVVDVRFFANGFE